jgi:Xaa-Pro aminopeptidase
MRRGLIHWSLEELPAAALDARVARLQSAMRARGLGAVITYASFAQPAPLQWLCNYVPYWSEALLVVWAQGAPSLLVAGTPRTHGWIRSVSHSGALVAAPKPGAQAAELRGKQLPADARVGVIALDSWPWSVAEPLLAAGWGARWEDASALYVGARHPADDAEHGMARTALALAERALAAAPAAARQASEVIAAIDGTARTAGAEEVLPRIAPDLAHGSTLLRMEGDQALGERHAVECSLAYKGVWVRVGRCVARGAPPASWAAAEAWFEGVVQAMDATDRMAALLGSAPGRLTRWTLEASTGVAPLSVIAASGQAAALALPRNSLVVLSVQLALDDGPWLRSAPVRLGAGVLARAADRAVAA